MKRLAEIYGRMWCHIIMMKVDGIDTDRLEELMEDFEVAMLMVREKDEDE